MGSPCWTQIHSNRILIDAYNPTPRYDANKTFKADTPGEHIVQVVNTDQRNPDSQGNLITLSSVTVLPPARQSNLGLIIGMIFGLEVLLLGAGFLAGSRCSSKLAPLFNTKRSILLALMRLCDRRHLGLFPG